MSTKQRVAKSRTGRVTKQPAARRKQAVGAIQARRLAARHIMARMFDDAPVRDGAEMNERIYNLRSNGVWMVFPLSESGTPSLGSSLVVAVCKRTGRVLYTGPANDER